MLGLGSTSRNLYGPRTRPIYQFESKLGFIPELVYELEPKISFQTHVFSGLDFWVMEEWDTLLQLYLWVQII